MQKIVLASGNAGKLVELRAILSQKGINLISQSEYNVSDVEETGLCFVENALIKARHACVETGLPAIADDSGIEVDALDGEPGIYSARYAGASGPTADKDNNAKLLKELKSIVQAERTARFQCVIVYLRHAKDPMPLICQGTWEGRILFEESGSNGFGYDPLFYVPTHDCASADLSPKVKNSISHRGQALRHLLKCWNSHP
ncbi:MAG: non-canonical purine NTP pyrophosphatase, RdgB/HAM1 family [SAR86 cluster bacterium]|uniref:dITP/XTP pyrophosphatase n=1 Tax=SAR86 cluster bacterium TaxID=2030880 RepID=A0A2A5BA35_9GAMM|nr:MAG: non-canonical purine NTP pyrophosphatase, RdgB/HAM1 family [SAR86 cluster bacterium]